MNKLVITALSALAIGMAGCAKKQEAPQPAPAPPPATAPAPTPPPPPPAAISLSTITVGNAIGADKKVTTSPATLGKKDTIYASVDTTGSGTATLTARWTYLQGGSTSVVHEETQTINPVGPATSEFHVSKPDGWPPGEYQVEIFVDEVSAGTKTFTVK